MGPAVHLEQTSCMYLLTPSLLYHVVWLWVPVTQGQPWLLWETDHFEGSSMQPEDPSPTPGSHASQLAAMYFVLVLVTHSNCSDPPPAGFAEYTFCSAFASYSTSALLALGLL